MLEVKTPPASEPVTLPEVKNHLRIDTNDHDTRLTALIQAARERTERYLGRALVTQTLLYKLDVFPATIELPRPPIQGVNSLKYVDATGATKTLNTSKYKVAGDRIIPTDGWPVIKDTIAAVTVDYDAGYGDPDAVPEAIKEGVLIQVERMFDRTDMEHDKTLASVAASVLWPYRQIAVV
jgi:uncharacterized phiE125 gp8 family phage protein